MYTKFWIGEANKIQEMWIYQAEFIDYSWHAEKCKSSQTHHPTQNDQVSAKFRNCENPLKPRYGVCWPEVVWLLQDNSLIHNSCVVQTEAQSWDNDPFLTLLTLPALCHQTSIFPTMKSFVKGKRFSNDESLVSKVKVWLHAQPAELYGRGLHNCIKQWEKYITLVEAYVEKDE